MPRADPVHPDLQPRVAGRERTRRTGVVEVDVGQEQVLEILDRGAVPRQLGLERRQVGGGPAVDQRGHGGQEEGGDGLVDRLLGMHEIDGNRLHGGRHDSGLPYRVGVTAPEDRMATTGEAVVRLLEQYGTDTVFGIPGVHTLEIYRGLAASSIRHVAPRHEQGAGFMADALLAHRRQAGRLRAHHGRRRGERRDADRRAPSTTRSRCWWSAPTPARASAAARVGPLHDLPDQHAFMSTITAESILVSDPAELPDAFARAWEIFEVARGPGPAHIGVPIDVLDLPAAGSDRLDAHGVRPVADAAAVAQAAAALAGARTPVRRAGRRRAGAPATPPSRWPSASARRS